MSMLSAGLQVIGGGIQAMGAMQQANAEAQAHEYNAAVADRNREIIAEQTHEAEVDMKLTNRRNIRSVRAAYGANGVTLTGSALDVLRDTAREQALDVERIGYKGRLLQIEQIDQANLERMSADTTRQAGTLSAAAAILGGLGGAATTLARAA